MKKKTWISAHSLARKIVGWKPEIFQIWKCNDGCSPVHDAPSPPSYPGPKTLCRLAQNLPGSNFNTWHLMALATYTVLKLRSVFFFFFPVFYDGKFKY